MDPIQFDQLPDLCLRKVFSFLSIRDLARCRAVSRQFKFYADHTKVTELVVQTNRRGNNLCKKWFRTNSSIDFDGAISLNTFESVKSTPFKLDQLKFLHITGKLSSDAIYTALNDLQQLIHLELCSEGYNLTRTLVLPNLKLLLIESMSEFVLETPKLEVLSCEAIPLIQIVYPETIKLVDCIIEGGSYGDLAKLRQLEVLIVYLGTYSSLDGISLSDLTALKELNLTCNLYKNEVQFMNPVLNLMHEKNAFQRNDLKMYLNEVLLVDAKQLAALDVLFDSSIANNEDQKETENAFKFMNYRLLLRDSYPAITSVDFSHLMRLDFEISEDFFDCFPQIRSIIATDLVDREHFGWFLQNAIALRTLKLTDTRLDQAFMNHLPKLCSRLTRLEVNDSLGLVTDFQFILQLEHLEVFETDRPLHSFALAAVAFRQSAKLENFRFRSGNSLVKIERSSSPEDNYTFRLFRIVGNREITETMCHENLSWAQLVIIYEYVKTGHIDVPEQMMRVKRIRLD